MKEANILGKQYVVDIFLFLNEREETTTSHLKEISSYYQGVVQRAKELEKLGFVNIVEQRRPFHKKTFSLTPEGRKVAEVILEAEKMVKEMEADSYHGWV